MADETMDTGVQEGAVQPEVQSQEPVVQEQPATQPSTPQVLEFEIDGIGKVKADEIKEWKSGYMRQSDYTRKTQEIAKSRNESKEAMELFTYLKNNPYIAKALSEGDYSVVQGDPVLGKALNPTNSQYADVQFEIASMKLDAEISRLKGQYPDFNEVEVITEADKRGIADLEFVYKALQGERLPNLKSEIEKQVKASLTDEIRRNGIATQTIAATNDSKPTTDDTFGLSPEELAMATKMGLSPEKYAKGKQY